MLVWTCFLNRTPWHDLARENFSSRRFSILGKLSFLIVLWLVYHNIYYRWHAREDCHAIISSLVTERVQENKAQASSLYLFFYYLGSSVVGTISGYFWDSFAWIGVIALIVGLLAIGLILVFINETPSVVSTRNRDNKVEMICDKMI